MWTKKRWGPQFQNSVLSVPCSLVFVLSKTGVPGLPCQGCQGHLRQNTAAIWRDPAPPGMYKSLVNATVVDSPYQLVQDFFHQQYHGNSIDIWMVSLISPRMVFQWACFVELGPQCRRCRCGKQELKRLPSFFCKWKVPKYFKTSTTATVPHDII